MTIQWLKIKNIKADDDFEIHAVDTYEKGAFPSASVQENPSAEEHRNNCKEFGLVAFIMLGGMTQEEILADSRTEAAFEYAYTPDANPKEFGILCLETYQDICNGTIKIH